VGDDFELEAAYWLDLVNRGCDELEVQDTFERHGVDLARIQWSGGSAAVALSDAGMVLHLQRHGSGDFICGVEFAVSGLPDGGSYEGNLPCGIDAADTLMDITQKLHPATPTRGRGPGCFDAVFPEHRLVIQMDWSSSWMAMTCCSRSRGRPRASASLPSHPRGFRRR
jgi:hypothetical protein